MAAVLISIALTTGACAFMFFVLPFMDARSAKANPTVSRNVTNDVEDNDTNAAVG